MSGMRCFAAVKPSEAIQVKVAALQDELRRSNADVRWIGPEELHLTLRFFGDLEDPVVARLRQSLSTIASGLPRFSLAYARIGEFPRVIWVGGSAHAEALAAQIESAAVREGLAPDQYGFNAHLTIGRIRSSQGGKDLAAAILARTGLSIGADPVSEFSLIKSTLMSKGPVYETIETFTLAQA